MMSRRSRSTLLPLLALLKNVLTVATNANGVLLQSIKPSNLDLPAAADPAKPYVYTTGDLNSPHFPKFPGAAYLGYGLDMTQTAALKIESVSVITSFHPRNPA